MGKITVQYSGTYRGWWIRKGNEWGFASNETERDLWVEHFKEKK